ncbi:MAG: ROK family protein [Candidatus Gastranaerophilales bacterium]|nr:ROK family protein [Candidatus Gastranaerophilales bacterium]
MKIAGIDIGGTKISGAVIENGEIISEIIKEKTPYNSQKIIEIVFDIVEKLLNIADIKAIAIATAGAVNNDNSRVIGSTGNLPKDYPDIEFKKIFEEKFNIPCIIENDANAAAFAEYKIGAAKGSQSSITVTLGTGVGGGIILDGKILKGKSGAAGEVGHLMLGIKPERSCTCGEYNCFEAYGSGTGFRRTIQELSSMLPEFKTSILSDKTKEELTTFDVIAGYKNGDEFCKIAYETWENEIIIGLTSLANIFDPDNIVISGGLSGEVNYEKIEKTINDKIVTTPLKILPAKAGNYAGMIGAALLAEDKLV